MKFVIFLGVLTTVIVLSLSRKLRSSTNNFRPYSSYQWPFKVSIRPLSTAGFIRRQNEEVRAKPVSYFSGFPSETKNLPQFTSNDIDAPDPPPHEHVAKMARYIVAQSLWTSLGTISSRSPTVGSPFSTILSVSDGTPSKSTGNPYLYMTPLDLSAMDLQVNPNASMVMTLAQGEYCDSHGYDPEDPRCAIVSLTGRVVKLAKGSVEERFAKMAIFSKHPSMRAWPKDHDWFVAVLEVENILVRDYFGGAKEVMPEQYFSVNPNSLRRPESRTEENDQIILGKDSNYE